jgi:hypothetical protein
VTLLASTDARMTEAAASESPAVFDASPRGLEAPAPAVAVAPLPAASGGQVTLVSLLTDQGLDQPSM